MEPGKIVYLCWYDFQREKEYVLSGEVADNALFAGTQWQDFILVQFKPVGMSKTICHHFRPEQLSVDSSHVPHDDAYLVVHGKQTKQLPAVHSNPWQAVQQFKEAHWDTAHNHLHVDALDDFYNLWRTAVAVQYGITIEEAPATVVAVGEKIVAVDPGSPDGDKPCTIIVDTETGEILSDSPSPQAEVVPQPIVTEERYQELKQKMKSKLTRKQLRSTGRIQYTDSIQTSFFD